MHCPQRRSGTSLGHHARSSSGERLVHVAVPVRMSAVVSCTAGARRWTESSSLTSDCLVSADPSGLSDALFAQAAAITGNVCRVSSAKYWEGSTRRDAIIYMALLLICSSALCIFGFFVVDVRTRFRFSTSRRGLHRGCRGRRRVVIVIASVTRHDLMRRKPPDQDPSGIGVRRQAASA
jgi:hypothetical protein